MNRIDLICRVNSLPKRIKLKMCGIPFEFQRSTYDNDLFEVETESLWIRIAWLKCVPKYMPWFWFSEK